MQSAGLVFKKDELVIVSLNQGISKTYLEGYSVLPLAEFKEDDEREEAVLHCLERFFRTYKGGKYNLFVAFPEDIAISQFLHLPLAVEEDLTATLGYEIDSHTPFSFDEVYYDYHITGRFPESNLLCIMLVTVKRDIVEYYRNLLKKINIKPRGMETTATALFNVFQKHCNISADVPDISSVKIREIWKDQILNIFNRTTPEKKDENNNSPRTIDLLVEYMNGSYELNLLSNNLLCYSKTFPCVGDIPSDTHFLEMNNNAIKAAVHLPLNQNRETSHRIILSGKEMDETYIDNIPEEIRPHFSVMQNLPVALEKKDGVTPSVYPVLSVAVGPALKGLTNVPLDVNFIPLAQRPKKKKSKKKMLAVAVAVLLFCSGTAYFVNNFIKMSIKQTVLSEQLRELKFQVQSIEEMQKDAEKIEQFSTGIKNIRKENISKLKLLEELTRIIPDDSWLTEFKYHHKDNKIKVSGYAVSASKLIPLLEESSLFEDVKFTSRITKKKGGDNENFRVEMKLSTEKIKP